MHYIEYIPGTIARITEHPTRHGHEDVNILSRFVCKFNQLIKTLPVQPNHKKVKLFVEFMHRFQLP
jgi:hypothetical protein